MLPLYVLSDLIDCEAAVHPRSGLHGASLWAAEAIPSWAFLLPLLPSNRVFYVTQKPE